MYYSLENVTKMSKLKVKSLLPVPKSFVFPSDITSSSSAYTAINFSGHFVKANETHMLDKLSTVTLITSALWACGSAASQNSFAINESIRLFPCHTRQPLRSLKVSNPVSNSIHPFIFGDGAMCSACRWLFKALAVEFSVPPENGNLNRLRPLEQIDS